ncbi:MAG TPA: CsbD family protein [bacterium]|nr:CsbD family protein [bacterium]
MNESQTGKWDNLKEIVKKKWEALTEEDFKKADGSMFKLYGVIRAKFGDTAESIKEKTDLKDQK